MFFLFVFCFSHVTTQLTPSLAAALVHNHVLVVPEEHFSVLVVEHAQRAHFGRGAAGGRHSVRVEMLQQALRKRHKTEDLSKLHD